MRRLIGIWLGVAAVVACGTQIDLGSSPETSRDGGIDSGAGSSSGSTGGDATTTPSDDSSSPVPLCVGASFTESFSHDAGAGAPTVEGAWDPTETNWNTPTSSNVSSSLMDENQTYSAYVFKAAPLVSYVYIQRELDTTCAKLELGVYVTATPGGVDFDLFNVDLDDGSTLVLRYRGASSSFVAGINPPGTDLGDTTLEREEMPAKIGMLQKLHVVFSTDGSVVARIDPLADVVLRQPSSRATKFLKLRMGPNVVAAQVDVTVANFSLEAKK